MSQKKIFIVSLSEITHVVGGAITITINMCNFLVKAGYEVYCICSDNIDGRPQQIDEKVNFINLAYRYNGQPFSKAINQLAEEVKPDLFIFFFSFLYENAQLSAGYINTPKVIMFHSRPDFYFQNNCDKLKKLYSCDKNIISQILFDSYKSLLPDFIRNRNVITIPNGVKTIDKTINTDIEHKKIIYLSRINCWKGLEFLINSFKLIAQKYPDWSIDIYGQSQPEEYVNELKCLVKKLKLEKQINFQGITRNPIETMMNYDFCVFPSYFEGFPMGLIESLSVGLPCIGLEECSGVNEIISDGENGFLAQEDYADFSQKIEALIKDKELREKMSQKAKQTADKYDKKQIDEKWLSVIKNLLNNEAISIEQTPDVKGKKLFPLAKIQQMYKQQHKKYIKPWDYIFSIKNSQNKKRKIITVLGLQIKFKRKRK